MIEVDIRRHDTGLSCPSRVINAVRGFRSQKRSSDFKR